MTDDKPTPKVFISYSHKDKAWVRDYLLTKLEDNGILCHIDYRDFEIGTASLINMEQAVEKCQKTILVWTPNWVNSEFTTFEGLMLQTSDPAGLNKRIFPIMLKECTPPKRLSIFTYADFTDESEWDGQIDRVIKQLKYDLKLAAAEQKTYPRLEDIHVNTYRLPRTRFELFGRHKELTMLNEAWGSGAYNVISFVAYGGVGKSTLVNKWVEKMRWEHFRGAEKVYAWSFHSQGTGEHATSADIFINRALLWFGDDDPRQGSPWDKGKRLAGLINAHKTLLILDGLEPLQSGEIVEKGKIKDPGLATLIIELAKSNKGLCIISTREHIPELDRYKHKTRQLDLEHISDEAGRMLLELRSIEGSEKEKEQLVRQFGNHALAISLVAEFIHVFDDHLIKEAYSIPDLVIPEKQGKHARRIIEALANHFGSESVEYQLLMMLGLFNQPVPIDALNAILNEGPIPNLTDRIIDKDSTDFSKNIKSLRNVKLLYSESEHQPDALDCHPLIREHFADKLQEEHPEAWKEAHARLYKYYKTLPKKELPDTLEEMEPLFAAVRHGCLAGEYQQAFVDVYWERIRRKTEAYTVHKLGAFGSDLSCLSNFFETIWDKPAPDLSAGDRAVCLSWAGFVLRAVGRLAEAAQPMKAGLEMQIGQEDWQDSARIASNLSELHLTLGDVAAAREYGQQSVDFADKSGDEDMMFITRTKLADASHQAGDVSAAEALFNEAEKMQKERQPAYPYLYSFRGFNFCDLLLSRGKHKEALERAQSNVQYEKEGWYPLLSIALDKLTIGKAYMYLSNFRESEKYLNQAVDDLREAGTQHRLPWALLARAGLSRIQKDFPGSWTDLDEAYEIAEYGQMRLHLTDYHLEACRNIKAQLLVGHYQIIENGETLSLSKEAMQAKYREHFTEAERLIEETGYHRRDGELEELRDLAGG